MMKRGWISVALCLGLAGLAQAREAKVVRSPSYHDGKVAFSYLGDIWTAKEDGSGIVRLTANKARDLNPRFSPDGKTIAFSSDREGGLDVYLIPSTGGDLKRLTLHSADDTVLGWSPDGKSVLFASQRGEDFMGKLYTVAVDGGASKNAGPDMGVAGAFSPDGTKLAINRKAQSYWRKYYRGAYQSDVTVMDLASKTFKDLTDFDGMDSWPMWSSDGRVYFVSDRDPNSQANIWYVPESGGDAVKVTDFKDGDVRFPSISADGKTVVFERDFGVCKLDLASKTVTPLHFDIAAETQESLTEFRDFNSTVDDYDVAPNGRRVAFAVHGRIFTAPTDENGELRQITDGPVRDQDLAYSPDGKYLAFVSDKTGREEIYVTNPDGSGEPKKVTDIDALKSGYIWSPDSKSIAFTTSEGKLYTMTAEGADLKELASSKYGNIGRPAWSPDGKWLAFSKPDVSRSNDVYLIPAAGGDATKVTFDSLSEMNPQFSADSKKLYFIRMEAETGEGQGARPSSQIYCIPLERLDKDPEEPEVAAAPEAGTPGEEAPGGRRGMGPGGPGAAGGRVATPKEPKIDWAGLKRRTRQVTRAGSVRNYIPGVDGKTLIFVGSEGGGGGGGGFGGGGGGSATIYTIQDDGKRLNSLVSSTPVAAPAEGDTPTPPPGRRGGGFGGGGISSLALTRDGRTLYFQEGDAVYSTTVSLGAAGGTGGGPAAGGFGGGGGGGGRGGRGGMAAAPATATATPAASGSKRKVTFNVTLEINKPAEWGEMFDDAWRTMKYRFYDAKMHGKDWDAMRAKYKPLVSYVGDTHELMNVINEMIGELNASHTGASPAAAGRGERSGALTRHLGIDLVSDDPSGFYKVGHVYEDGPLDKDWFKVEKGNYLVAIDGKPVKTSDDVTAFLGRRLNRKVELTINTKPEDAGSWKIKYEPIASAAFANLRYERWVKERRAKVDELSKGRVGYLHIKAMDQPSLARFKKDLAEFRHKEALVIDQRWNGGGNIEQELLAILVQRPYQVWQPRGTEPTPRPFNGYFGPKVVMQNWRSASNAEMFPAGFRALGLGKVVGTPTMGAVIGTGSYSLIDGSTIRTPGVGVYLSDEARTNMENTGVKPDVYVENSPEDNLAGRDRQLEVAVKEVMKGLKPDSDVAGRE
jgi:tricorn protease